MAGWGQGFFEGAGTLAGSIGEGLLAALRREDPRDRNPTGLTPEQFAALQRGESVTPPQRPGLGESLLGLTPVPSLVDAWKASDTAGEGGYEGGRATGTALATLATLAMPGGKALRAETRAPIRAYHASPHSFDRFDASKIGTGEGAQAYGHGLYAAESPAVSGRGGSYDQTFTARNLGKHDLNQQEGMILKLMGEGKSDLDILRDLARYGGDFDQANAALERIKANKAHIYEVGIHADPARFLDWDKPLSAQSEPVQKALAPIMEPLRAKMVGDASAWGKPSEGEIRGYRGQADEISNRMTGEQIYQRSTPGFVSSGPYTEPKHHEASALFSEAGIPGIRYLDQGSRGVVGAELIDVAKGADGWKAKLRIAGAPGFRGAPGGTSITTSKPYATEAEARAWAEQASRSGTSNYVVFPGNERLIEILRKYGLLPAAALPAAAAVPGLLSQPGEQ